MNGAPSPGRADAPRRSATGRRWAIHPPQPTLARALAEALHIAPIATQALINRGVRDAARGRAFLQPTLNDLHDPSDLPDAERAAERLIEAARRRERIVVYGDYDADGVAATALLVRCLRLLGADAGFYLPDRLEEGYGLNPEAVRRLAAEGTRLLVTVDCGIGAAEEVALARRLGMQIIISDHHELCKESAEVIAHADAVVSALREDSRYPFDGLAGVGVAFKLAWAVGKRLNGGVQCSPAFRDFLLDAVSLAALGTIADVVPLLDENRALAHYGLGGLSCSRHPGLSALRRAACVEGDLTAFDVAFKLGPRLNAAGRLGAAHEAVELLLTDDAARAEEIAAHLTAENGRRQRIQEGILQQAREQALQGPPIPERPAVVVARAGWHPGVVGIVAARLVEEFHRPAICLCIEGDEAHGSGRSVEGVDLVRALADCEDLLSGYGGHARAAGVRLRAADLPAFEARFAEAVAARVRPEDMAPVLRADACVRLSALTGALVRDLERLEPCGEGNPAPLLVTTGLTAQQVRRMGARGAHVSFWVRQDDVAARAVGFHMGDLADALPKARVVSLAYRPRINVFRGASSIELLVEDVALTA